METKLLKVFSFLTALMAYSFHPLLWDGAFYHLTALSFVGLTRIIWLKSYGSWKLFAMVMNLMCWNNLFDEIFFNPTVIDYNEYITLLITILIVLKNREKWSK
jgi:hypothetical protein|tara:strand:+ start:265 stop:573 length:309 start_codon:yes stop_codon:yes gene_type:complete